MVAETHRAIRGFVDSVSASEVVGWVVEADREEPLSVKLEVDGTTVEETEASELRPATKHLGLHPTGRCGFRFLLGGASEISAGSSVRILVAGSDAGIKNSPWQLQQTDGGQPDPPEDDSSGARVFFMHIPKTAGSSFNAQLTARFAGHRVATHIESTGWGSDPEEALTYRFVSGHVRIAQVARRVDLSEYVRVTLLREPFAQLASHLAWVRSVADDATSDFHRMHGPHIRTVATRLRAVDFSSPAELEAYGQSMNPTELDLFDNCQTRYFLPESHEGAVSESALERALETLATIDLVGVVERYDDFARQLCDRLSWDPIDSSQRLNVTTERYGLDVHDAGTRTALGNLVRFDRQLYANVAAQLSRA